jgi:hypothetical protein
MRDRDAADHGAEFPLDFVKVRSGHQAIVVLDAELFQQTAKENGSGRGR